MSVRDRGLERATLARAERDAGATGSGFSETVVATLNAVTREHGDTFDERPLLDLIAEVGSEAIDTAAWSLLALTNLSVMSLPPALRERLQATLDALVTCGAEAHLLVQRAEQSARAAELDA